jgi:hypothetical protein
MCDSRARQIAFCKERMKFLSKIKNTLARFLVPMGNNSKPKADYNVESDLDEIVGK